MSKSIAIIQCRMNSTRLPGKALIKIKNLTVVDIIYKRLMTSKKLDEIVFAIPFEKNNQLKKYLLKRKYKFYEGSQENVLLRYLKTAKKFHASIVTRVTGDCPFVDPNLVDKALELFEKNRIDYVSNTLEPTYPDGLDVEVFSLNALKKANQNAKSASDREHVTPIMKYSKKFKKLNFKNNLNLSQMNWTLDENKDLIFIKNVFLKFKDIYFDTRDICRLLKKDKKIRNLQNHKTRDEGYKMKIGQKLWRRAQSLIPGGNMLISKREERFLPNHWPNYFSKAKGCFVWGMDGKKYIDISLMGVGTNILGYANLKIDREVNKIIRKSNMSTLNCPEEVYLIEKLIKSHPWFQMGKSTRSGGEANAVAIRIARATQKKRDKVAICGYHGWHDWYVAANLNNKKNLDTHLLTGIEPLGVPSKLKNSTFTFEYNNFQQLKKLVNKNKDIGIIKMEVMRNTPPKNNFLKKVRKFADKKKIILIFDECTSGFRETNGGLHKKYNIKPDLAIFGKALGNGYPINIILGKEWIMKNASKTFISSTFWSDRIGPTAAIKTLDEMEKIQSWKIITSKGKKVIKFWKKMSKKYQLGLQISGLPSLCTFNFKHKDNQKIKTFINQEMLKKGFLASNSVYLSTSHTNKILRKYFKNLEQVFKKCSVLMKTNEISKYLEGPVISAGFKRLN